MVSRPHVPPADVLVLKNSASDLMTRSVLIAQAPARPDQTLIHRNARRIGEIRRTIAIRRETEHGNRPGFAAGTQGEGGVSCGAKPSADMETGTSARRRGSGNVGRAVSINAAQLGHPTNEEMRNDFPIPASFCYWVTDYSIPFSLS